MFAEITTASPMLNSVEWDWFECERVKDLCATSLGNGAEREDRVGETSEEGDTSEGRVQLSMGAISRRVVAESKKCIFISRSALFLTLDSLELRR